MASKDKNYFKNQKALLKRPWCHPSADLPAGKGKERSSKGDGCSALSIEVPFAGFQTNVPATSPTCPPAARSGARDPLENSA